jgi:hypothetical protein
LKERSNFTKKDKDLYLEWYQSLHTFMESIIDLGIIASTLSMKLKFIWGRYRVVY